MIALIVFLLQLTIVFLLARSFAKHLFLFCFLLTRSQAWSIRLTSLFLLPGTLIHELSHLLVAEIVQVHTGKLTILPVKKEDGTLQLGSVAIAHCDPFRRTLIGIAPVLTGLFFITILTTRLPSSPLELFNFQLPFLTLAIYYLLLASIFLISNTMFSSPKDLEVAFVPFFCLLLLIGAWWYFEWPISKQSIEIFTLGIYKLNIAFFITILINIFFLGGIKLLKKIFEKVLKRRIVTRS